MGTCWSEWWGRSPVVFFVTPSAFQWAAFTKELHFPPVAGQGQPQPGRGGLGLRSQPCPFMCSPPSSPGHVPFCSYTNLEQPEVRLGQLFTPHAMLKPQWTRRFFWSSYATAGFTSVFVPEQFQHQWPRASFFVCLFVLTPYVFECVGTCEKTP